MALKIAGLPIRPIQRDCMPPRVASSVAAMDDPRATIHSLVRRNLGPIKPVKSVPAHLSRSMRPEDAFRTTLLDCLAQITANAATLRAGRSVEGLHQLRVAFRRLEVALGAFGQEFDQDWLEELRGRAKILSGRLAPARDLDVFVGKLLEGSPQFSVKSGVGDGLAALRARAESARDEAWSAAAACTACCWAATACCWALATASCDSPASLGASTESFSTFLRYSASFSCLMSSSLLRASINSTTFRRTSSACLSRTFSTTWRISAAEEVTIRGRSCPAVPLGCFAAWDTFHATNPT